MRRASIGWLAAGALASAWIGAGAGGCGSSGKTDTGGTTTGAGGTTTSSGSTGTATTGTAGTTSSSGTTSATGTTGSTGTGTGTGGSVAVVGDSVLMHHKNPNRDGVYVEPTFTKAAMAGLTKDTTFNVTLPDTRRSGLRAAAVRRRGRDGQGLVFVATEANNVYALDADTGAVVWKKNVGAPVPLS